VLTYLLWGAVLKLQETRTRLVQMVLSLGLYFSAYAGSYALVNLAPKYGVVQYLAPILGCFLPISWAVSVMRHSEEARSPRLARGGAPMMAAFILAFSLLTLLMFFVSYCRSLTASSLHTSISEDVRDVLEFRSAPLAAITPASCKFSSFAPTNRRIVPAFISSRPTIPS